MARMLVTTWLLTAWLTAGAASTLAAGRSDGEGVAAAPPPAPTETASSDPATRGPQEGDSGEAAPASVTDRVVVPEPASAIVALTGIAYAGRAWRRRRCRV